MKRLLLTASALLFTLGFAEAASVKIAFTIHSSPSNTFWQAVKKGFDDACSKVQADCQMIFTQTEGSIEQQAANMQAAIAGKPDDMTVCMHLCRGNFAGAWIADGGYEPIAELLFNAIGVDGYFLEYDSARAGGFEPLRFLPKGKIAVLGLVTTKSPAMETKDELKRRIDEASRYAPLEQLALSPQCGFSSGIGGNAMTVDDEIKKLELVVDTARDVWGSS